jgi:hypothetical protein
VVVWWSVVDVSMTMSDSGRLKRWWKACGRWDSARDTWTVVAALLAFLMLDSIPLAIAIGAGVWAALGAARS